MIVRVLLAVDSPTHRRRLRAAFQQPDVVVDSIRASSRLWERISRESGDLIVVSESLIPEPVAETIGMLGNLPGTPWVVVVSDKDDPEEHAALLGAGCDTVLYTALSAEALQEVVDTLLDKRRGAGARGRGLGEHHAFLRERGAGLDPGLGRNPLSLVLRGDGP